MSKKIKTCLISVYDKTGIVEFAKALDDLGISIYSTGGTETYLKEANLPVKSISELTKFPEILDGRVKTLHPAIHGGILARFDDEKHINQLKEHNLIPIDMVVVNLYPFEAKLLEGASHEQMIENIDIGGPTMLRASAKNYKWCLPVVSPKFYDEIVRLLKENECEIPEDFRLKMASEVFNHISYYDGLVSKYFREYIGEEEGLFPEKFAIPLKREQKMRYGENPHQKAFLYGNFQKIFKQLHGKELSYNNIMDIDSAAKLIIEFDEPACAIIKHTNPCGVGIADNLKDAYNKAFTTDNVSPFGGIIVFNRQVDLETAETVHSLFTEVIIANGFTDEALELLTKKKDRRLILVDFNELRKSISFDMRSVANGLLIQSSDNILYNEKDLKVVTKREPTKSELEAMMFGWKVVKHVKSNAIVYSKADRTLAIGAGQMSRVDSSRFAIEKAKMMGLSLVGSAICSDAFFPFPDGIEEAGKAGATAVIQPGGSIRDNDVIKMADELNMAMIFTNCRHFKH